MQSATAESAMPEPQPTTTQSVKRQFRLSQQSRKPGATLRGTLGFLLAHTPCKRLKLGEFIEKTLLNQQLKKQLCVCTPVTRVDVH
ncbi:hypothetical protein [Acidovorax sp. NB1]|uniref:hypothetical protein n=1 Tax=Acidovorax sp. NB1 TaxID=1943571 RepID=UPI0010F87B91|nr:hypothetical protein [Acidovorax sp. NB1]